MGGPTLAASLARLGLIDAFRRYVVPVTIGEGLPYFLPEAGRLELELAGTETFPNGVLLERYRRPSRG